MESERIARLARDSFLNEPLFQGFTDIRKRPRIKLRTILTSLFTMPLFGIKLLLSNDRQTRGVGYKKLFGCLRKMVCSDSTFARVLRWLKPAETQEFLLEFLPRFEKRDLLRKRLSPNGRPRRLGILDGTYMGGHWLVTLCLAGRINYAPMVRRCENHGDEQTVARAMMVEATEVLGELRPELWLLDGLYFNRNTIEIAAEQKAHVLFKFKDPDFRTVAADAANLFQHYGGDEEYSGWDPQRQCRWKLRKTIDNFYGYRVQVVELREYYPKRKKNRNICCWIVTTEMDLEAEELREAAHQRWQIENNIFKRISHLTGTKRFYFRDHRQFFNLLRIFLAAVAVLDCILALLKAHKRLFTALRQGIKPTWRNVFSRMQEVLYELPCAFHRMGG